MIYININIYAAYTEKLFEWIAARIDDPTIFVSGKKLFYTFMVMFLSLMLTFLDGNYTKKFNMTVKKIFTRMFRV